MKTQRSPLGQIAEAMDVLGRMVWERSIGSGSGLPPGNVEVEFEDGVDGGDRGDEVGELCGDCKVGYYKSGLASAYLIGAYRCAFLSPKTPPKTIATTRQMARASGISRPFFEAHQLGPLGARLDLPGIPLSIVYVRARKYCGPSGESRSIPS